MAIFLSINRKSYIIIIKSWLNFPNTWSQPLKKTDYFYWHCSILLIPCCLNNFSGGDLAQCILCLIFKGKIVYSHINSISVYFHVIFISKNWVYIYIQLGLPGGASGKEPAYARQEFSTSGSGRSPEGGYGNPL